MRWLHACSPPIPLRPRRHRLRRPLSVIHVIGPSASRPLGAWQPSVSVLRSAQARSVEPLRVLLAPSPASSSRGVARAGVSSFCCFCAGFSCAFPPCADARPLLIPSLSACLGSTLSSLSSPPDRQAAIRPALPCHPSFAGLCLNEIPALVSLLAVPRFARLAWLAAARLPPDWLDGSPGGLSGL